MGYLSHNVKHTLSLKAWLHLLSLSHREMIEVQRGYMSIQDPAIHA